jgi:hypothetical protein
MAWTPKYWEPSHATKCWAPEDHISCTAYRAAPLACMKAAMAWGMMAAQPFTLPCVLQLPTHGSLRVCVPGERHCLVAGTAGNETMDSCAGSSVGRLVCVSSALSPPASAGIAKRSEGRCGGAGRQSRPKRVLVILSMAASLSRMCTNCHPAARPAVRDAAGACCSCWT